MKSDLPRLVGLPPTSMSGILHLVTRRVRRRPSKRLELAKEVQRELRQAWQKKAEPKAVANFSCPTCGARAGERCMAKETHKRRVNKALATTKPPRGFKQTAQSVRAVSGGGFETNRRRH